MNNRIDLTQFEGITPAQWRVDYEAVGDTKTVLYVKSDMTAHDNFVIAVLEDDPNGEYTEADANAIAAVHDLIDELKRRYEEIDEVRWMLMQAYDGQKEREREIDYLRSYCLDNGVCPYCGEAQQDPALREHLGVLKMCYSCEDKIHFGIEPNDNASE